MLEVSNRIRIPLSEFDFSYARAGGPGGQHVNKTQSKAVLYWQVESSPSLPQDVRDRFMQRFGKRVSTDGTLVLSSDRYRDQRRNVDDCLDKLAEMLREVAMPPKKRKPTKPSKAQKQKRLDKKRQQSERKNSRRKPDY